MNAFLGNTAPSSERTDAGIFRALLGDGRFLIALTGVALMTAGGFALFLCVTGHFLPQDVGHLGMDAPQLARVANQRLVNFMFHDRAAFGGSLMAIGAVYLWVAGFPLRRGEAWAWWTLVLSGVLGFGSFLTYLGYGYLDTWHGVATLFLLPVFAAGLVQSWRSLPARCGVTVLLAPASWASSPRRQRAGRWVWLSYAAGLVFAGATICLIGMRQVFVGTDLDYIRMTQVEICGVSDHLVPVIAHDRAGFGGVLVSIGVTLMCIIWHAGETRSFREIMLLSGAVGFAAAIGVHFVIGYTNPWHLAPAFAGAAIFLVGWVLTAPPREARADLTLDRPSRTAGALSPD